MKAKFPLAVAVISLLLSFSVMAEEMAASEGYIPSLITETPYQGRLLAIKIVRKTIGTIQTNGEAKHRVRAKYAEDPALLMNAAELVAIEFKTIAIANDYWRK
ncbi:hexameric tyrosine-coordinated heme protein [Methylophaga sp.]|uniref:hexameric tyrosine-coordinated heme protein n=1 Tax=Methylophaga sp. TaxID=2024840 RepID=UPI003F6965B8